MNIDQFLCTLLAGLVLGGLFGFGCSAKLSERKAKQEAISAGVAEYYLDAHHERQFRYITNGGKR